MSMQVILSRPLTSDIICKIVNQVLIHNCMLRATRVNSDLSLSSASIVSLTHIQWKCKMLELCFAHLAGDVSDADLLQELAVSGPGVTRHDGSHGEPMGPVTKKGGDQFHVCQKLY